MNPQIGIEGQNTQFSKDRQPENAGRRKSVWKHLRDQYELSSEDVAAIIQNLSRMSKEELKEVANDPKTTMLELAYISAYMQAVKKGTLNELEMMLNRVIGKVKETHEVTGNLFEELKKRMQGE